MKRRTKKMWVVIAVMIVFHVVGFMSSIDAGEYGFCKSSGNEIGEMRLGALPYATLCIDCAEGAEELDKEVLDPNEY